MLCALGDGESDDAPDGAAVKITPLAMGGKLRNQYFFATSTKLIVWGGVGAKEEFEAHLKKSARKAVVACAP